MIYCLSERPRSRATLARQVRFDPVYVGHFKCNLRTIRDGYPNLHLWLRRLYWNIPAFRETCDFDHIKTHYYWSHPMVRVLPFLFPRCRFVGDCFVFVGLYGILLC